MKKCNTAKRLKQIMNERGLRQVDIIKMSLPHQEMFDIKMSKAHLSQYVSGKYEPNQNFIFLLAKTLDVDPAWLMGYELDDEEPIETPTTTGESTKKLPSDEEHLLNSYRKLNDFGKQVARLNLDGMTKQSDYAILKSDKHSEFSKELA